MDRPNVRVNVRRHNSMPTVPLRRRTTTFRTTRISQQEHRRNPYVDYRFRNIAPAVSEPSAPRCVYQRMKNSPYVGWFRHAPSRWEQEISLFLHSFPRKQTTIAFADLLASGHLKGGLPPSPQQQQSVEALCRSLQNCKDSSSSGTVKVLSKLAHWFLSSFQDEEVSSYCRSIKSLETFDYDDEDLDDFDAPHRHHHHHDDSPSSLGVSSQAQAYYAHQAAKEMDYDDGGEHRLDYVITQMDIVRMTRNASRDLDVESILKLPTRTYRKHDEEKTKPEGWSWMLVQRGLEVSDPDEHHKQQDVCVICLEHFCDGDKLRVLPCNHSFHIGCIDRWLSGSHSFDDCYTSGCPTCKKRPSDFDGAVPSWAFSQIGSALSREPGHFQA